MGKRSNNKQRKPEVRPTQKRPGKEVPMPQTQQASPQLQRSLIVDGMHQGFQTMVNETLNAINAICSGNQFLMYHVLEETTARFAQLRRVGLTQSIAAETANRAGA